MLTGGRARLTFLAEQTRNRNDYFVSLYERPSCNIPAVH